MYSKHAQCEAMTYLDNDSESAIRLSEWLKLYPEFILSYYENTKQIIGKI